jgi:hypothetical protein
MAKTLCKTFDLVMLQEHWLLKDNLTHLSRIDPDFEYIGVSSMSRKASAVIISGRPFGGVALLWKNHFHLM